MRNKLLCLMVTGLSLTACSYSKQIHRRSNLVSYLYDGAEASPRAAGGNVRLQLPLRIGVAFVPPAPRQAALLPPDGEKRLIEIVRKSFRMRDWVGEIITIPSGYLVPGGGFENLAQVGQLMHVDVIALVSVDQLQVSDPRRTSFLYASILGQYVLPLDRNETRTLIDMAVFHVPSRTFLLRAPGVSAITGSSTAMDIDAKLRERSSRGFELAMNDLSKNLDTEVEQFKANVVSGEIKDIDIYTAKGESVRGGGAVDTRAAVFSALLLLFILAVRRP